MRTTTTTTTTTAARRRRATRTVPSSSSARGRTDGDARAEARTRWRFERGATTDDARRRGE
jgi:hypothetical protein